MELVHELARALKATLSALETPGDLSSDEMGWVHEDANMAIVRYDDTHPNPPDPKETL